MANIVEAINDVFTEEYALAKFFVYAIPVFICINAYVTGQFVLSGFCGFFVALLLLGLLTCGINNLRENKQEILTFNIQHLVTTTIKTAIVIVPQVSIALMVSMFIRELIPVNEEMGQLPMIVNIVIWSIMTSMITTSYLAYAKHVEIKDAFNIKLILESVVDVFVNLVFFLIQLLIADLIFFGMMSYVFTILNLPLSHPGFIFYCSLLIIINISISANILAQASYDCIKGRDEDYKDRYKIGSTLQTANFSGGITITPSGASPFIPGGITTTGSVNNAQPTQNRAKISRNHLNNKPRHISGKGVSNRTGLSRNTASGRTINTGNRQNIKRTSGSSPAARNNNVQKRNFGNSGRTSSGFGNNRFGKKKKDNGGFWGFFK